MNRQPVILCFIICLSLVKAGIAQNPTTSTPAKSGTKEAITGQKLNLLKVNLTGLVVKNYSLQYERVMSKSVGLAIAFRTMPTTSVPLKGIILKFADEDPDTEQVLNKLKMSNFAITPELRWYVGKKGYGRGFYIAPFYRYAKFKSNELVFEYDNFNITEEITLRGDQSSHTGGILFGAQWFLGKSLCLDWWILGPHYGSGNGNFTGLTDHLLTPQEQNSLRQSLEDVDLPLTNKTVTVNANGATVRLDGPWAGVRAGLSLGIRF
jgi:hypothetical protein